MRIFTTILLLCMSLVSFTAIRAEAQVAAQTLLCPSQQLRVARCERVEKGTGEADFVIEQMLICQDKEKNFSLQARYLDYTTNSLKETAPIPATGTKLKDSSVYYTTPTGLNLVLSANREQAVIQQCLLVNFEADLRANEPAGSGCLERVAVCK